LDETHPEDSRVLGGDRFLADLPQLKFVPRSTITLDQLAKQVCETYNISMQYLCSPSRRRSLTAIRLTFTEQAIANRIANVRQVADFLNRDPSSLNQLLARYRP